MPPQLTARDAIDPIFNAMQEIALNEKTIASAETTVRACEDELMTLRNIGLDIGSSMLRGAGATGLRATYLLNKMKEASQKIEKLEAVNIKLKMVLSR